jgi:hypothetical protein
VPGLHAEVLEADPVAVADPAHAQQDRISLDAAAFARLPVMQHRAAARSSDQAKHAVDAGSDADAAGGKLLGHDSRHQLVLLRQDALLAVEDVHFGTEMGEDGGELAAGVARADDCETPGERFHPPDVVGRERELGTGERNGARATTCADDRRIAFHGGAIGGGDGARGNETCLADVFVDIDAELAGFLGDYLAG